VRADEAARHHRSGGAEEARVSDLASYKDRYQHIRLTREGGILEMQLHTRGGPLQWGARDGHSIHAELGDAFYQIARDPENHVLILTGTGDEFLTGMDEQDGHEGAMDALFWDRMAQEGRDLLVNYLDIGAMVVSAVNGPVTFHPELPTLADIVVASDTAVFADPHLMIGAVPGDGAHVWWTMLLGPNRGRSFLITGERITAEEGKRLGFVTEVVPHGQPLARAREIAAGLAKMRPLTLRNARFAFTQEIKRRLLNDLHYGFALESLAAMQR
jgi:enoyl-CoA hydratase/carnithine racemase